MEGDSGLTQHQRRGSATNTAILALGKMGENIMVAQKLDHRNFLNINQHIVFDEFNDETKTFNIFGKSGDETVELVQLASDANNTIYFDGKAGYDTLIYTGNNDITHSIELIWVGGAFPWKIDGGHNSKYGGGSLTTYLANVEQVNGTNGADLYDLRGASETIAIFAGAGNDTFHGTELKDRFFGGDGNDEAYGYGGNDRLLGDAGKDTLYGGDGDDYIGGGEGSDTIYGGDGNDYINAGVRNNQDHDTVTSGSGHDIIVVGPTNPEFQKSGGVDWEELSIKQAMIKGSVTVAQILLEKAGLKNPVTANSFAVLFTYGHALFKSFDDPKTTSDITEDADYLDLQDYHPIYDKVIVNTASKHDHYIWSDYAIDLKGIHIYSDTGNLLAKLMVDQEFLDEIYDEIHGIGGVTENIIKEQIYQQFIRTGIQVTSDENNEKIARYIATGNIDATDSRDLNEKAKEEENRPDDPGYITDPAVISFINSLEMFPNQSVLLFGIFGPLFINGADFDSTNGTKVLLGGEYDDVIYVQVYEDSNVYDAILGTTTSNYILAGDGDDIMSGGLGFDYFNGGAGSDTVSYYYQLWDDSDSQQAQSLRGFTVDLADESAQSVRTGLGDDAYYNSIGQLYYYQKYEHDTDMFVDVENLIGSKYNDSFRGNSKDNIFLGMDGNDVLIGRGGNDMLIDGAGSDRLYGGTGEDILVHMSPEDGDEDNFWGGEGTDRYWIVVSDGNASGDYHLNIRDAEDGEVIEIDLTATGQDIRESDFTWQNSGNDTIFTFSIGGIHYEVTVMGYSDSDFHYHQTGFGTGEVWITTALEGTSGDDTLAGTDGDDWFVYSTGNDTIDGGLGHDILDFSGQETWLILEVGQGIANDFDYRQLKTTFSSIEEFIGSRFSDRMYGGDAADIFHGGAGFDWLRGGDGNDKLFGDSGADKLFGGAGDDLMLGGDDVDKLYFGTGNDTLYGGNGNDTFYYELGGDGRAVIGDAQAGDRVVFTIPEESSGDAVTDHISFDSVSINQKGGDVYITIISEGTVYTMIFENTSVDHMVYGESEGQFWYDFV